MTKSNFTYHYRDALSTKICSLGAEAVIIKTKEAKWKRRAKAARDRQKADTNEKSLWAGHYLRLHRLNIVRPEARAALVAHAFLRGDKYESAENHLSHWAYCNGLGAGIHDRVERFWKRVHEIVNKFSPKEGYALTDIISWREDHPEWNKITRHF